MSDEVLYTVKGPKLLEDMTWKEVDDLLAVTDTVIVPVGSTEQHGPHLPLAADTIQVVEMVRQTVACLAEEGITVLGGPVIPFGVAPYHMPFPGTISLRSDTLKVLIKDVCFSLYQHGFRRFVLLMGHGGNIATMQVAAQELVGDLPDSQVVFLNWLPALESKYSGILQAGRPQGHAGEGETARTMVTHPKLVHVDWAHVFYSQEAQEVESDDHPEKGGGILNTVRNWRDVTPYGNVGDPSVATAETGQKAYDIIVSWIVAAMKRTVLKNTRSQ